MALETTPPWTVETFTAEREWLAEGIPVLRARVALPQMKNAGNRVAQRIRRYYRAQCRAFLRYCERELFPMAAEASRAAWAVSAPIACFQTELSYETTYLERGFWSLYTQSREPMADGTVFLRRYGDTWDLRRGYPAALAEFFPPHALRKRQLLAMAAREIQRQERAGYARYRESWRRGLRKHWNPMHFYLTAEGLALFYPMLSIAPAVERIPVFTVPYGASPPEVDLAKLPH